MVVGAIDDESVAQGFGAKRSAVHGEIASEHQSFAANFADEIELGGEPFDSCAKFGASLTNVGEELFFFDYGEKLESGRAHERASAKRGSVHSWRKRGGELFIGDECAERQAAGERFRYGDDIRERTVRLIGEMAAGAAKAALNLVGD